MSIVSKYIKQLSRRDPALEWIQLYDKQLIDSELVELVDCLLVHLDIVKDVWLGGIQLTDKIGVKLAQYLASSTTIEWLNVRDNQLGEETYLALAAALRVNSSLRRLYLHGNQVVDKTRINAAFVEALRLNPDHPTDSEWILYSFSWSDRNFTRFCCAAEKSTPPSMLEFLLFAHLNTKKIETKKH